jgi:hypothetical protein
MIILRGSPRLAYAAAPCSVMSASLAVREGGDRGMLSRAMRTRLHLKPGQKGTKSCSRSMETASSACGIATMRSARSGSRRWS